MDKIIKYCVCFILPGILGMNGLTASAAKTLMISGITEPIHDQIVSSVVSGAIDKFHYAEGDRVKKGDVIIELDKKQEELEAARRLLVYESKVELDSAEQRVKTLKVDYEGTKRLYESTKSVSKDELDKKELEYMIAIAEYERLKVGEERERIEYEMAKEQIDRRIIKAPIDGIITEIIRHEGEICDAIQPLLRIVDVSQFYFVGHVASNESTRLRLGQETGLILELGDTDLHFTGKIAYISPITDPASGLRKIKALFVNNQQQAPPGMAGILEVTY